MSFRISRSASNGIELVHLHDEHQGVTVSIAPEYGAMLHAFEVPLEGRQYNVISNYSGREEVEEQLARSFRSSKLSPFPCRISGGRYTWEGRLYEFKNLFPDGTAIHGLLYNKSFSVGELIKTDFLASASFHYHYRSDDPGYPFDYTCTITYTLFPGKTLQLMTTVKNNGNATIPMADGWHPYFRLDAKVDDCMLSFPSAGIVEFDEKLVPTRQVLEYDRFNGFAPIGDIRLDNCFLVDPSAGEPACIFSNPAKGISIHFYPDESYSYLQLYIPDDRQSIAIENLTAAPDAFNNKMGLLLLEGGAEKSFTLHYEIKTTETA